MPLFYVNADQYFRGHFDLSDTSPDGMWRNKNVLLCQRPIQNLVDRYSLGGKSILSLGSGEGHEEYSLHQAGCRLTLNDINPAFEAYLHRLEAAPQHHPGVLAFSNEDAEACLRRFAGGGFDVLYVSSLHPDEIRRETIAAEFTEQSRRGEFYWGVNWPKGTSPYLDVLMEAFRVVKPGGLMIFQHYRGGVSISLNPHYLEDVRTQFAAHGATLLESYCFQQAPSVLLVVAFNGNENDARRYAESLSGKPEIQLFHGRFHDGGVKAAVVKVFDLPRPNIRPQNVFSRWSLRNLLARAKHVSGWRRKGVAG